MTTDIEPYDLHTQPKRTFDENFNRIIDGVIKFADYIPDDAIYYWRGWGVFDDESKNDYDKLEKIITDKITRPLWQKITKLKIEPCEFLDLFLSHHEQNCKKEIDRKKSLYDEAAIIQDAIPALANVVMNNRSYQTLIDTNKLAEMLLKILEKSKQDVRAFDKLSNAIGSPHFKTPEEIYFIKKIDSFFIKYATQRHELTAICYAVAFDKITEYDKLFFTQSIKDTLRENK
jgi:hypothetical protein